MLLLCSSFIHSGQMFHAHCCSMAYCVCLVTLSVKQREIIKQPTR
uniref:Uncharacterized protein n=1 Tax=Anguilla anguilla TaxID=7936 RepID=A0A0E9R4M4_ANGAN